MPFSRAFADLSASRFDALIKDVAMGDGAATRKKTLETGLLRHNIYRRAVCGILLSIKSMYFIS